MTAKKKISTIKGNGMTSALTKKCVDKKKPIAKPKYKPIFCINIVEKRVIKRDLNYYGIKQYLKNHIGVDLFKKLTNGDKEKPELKKEEKPKFKKYPIWDYYQEMNLVILNYWFKYSKYWDKVVNKHE
jgi:hypothetical protein